MRVLVVVASRHAATKEIGAAIGRTLIDAGHVVDVSTPEDVESLEGYDAFVIGSGVYYGKWLPAATAFVETHRERLTGRPIWLFSSGPTGATELKPEGEPLGVLDLVASLRARGHRVFAGRLDRGLLGLGEKVIVTGVRAQLGDFRDWDTIATWAHGIASELNGQKVPVSL